MKNYQQASDDVANIAETVETLAKQLDKFFEHHGEELSERVTDLLPFHEQLNGDTVKKLNKLSGSLAPPDDYDPADRNLVKFVMFGDKFGKV